MYTNIPFQTIMQYHLQFKIKQKISNYEDT